MEGYTFVRVEKKRLCDVQQLYLSAFGLSVTLAYLDAKYSTSCFGCDYIGFLAYTPEGLPAAYYGIFPMRIDIGGVSMLVGQSGDTMTSPSHRMRGLFVETAKRTYALAKQEGVQFVFGFPNEQSFPGFKSKLGWEFTSALYDFYIETAGIPLAAIGKRFLIVNKPIRSWINTRLNRLRVPVSDGIIEAYSVVGVNSVLRDRDFFEYKIRNGSSLVEWEGFVFFVRVDGVLIVGDVAVFDASLFSAFLDAIKSLGRYLYCHKVLLSLSKNHWLFVLFERNKIVGVENLPIGFLPINCKAIAFDTISFSRLDADTF